MSGLLINLAVMRDAAPGATLHYRFVDDGRARDAAVTRSALQREAPGRRRPALTTRCAWTACAGGGEDHHVLGRRMRADAIRILQHDDDGRYYDLRLVEYQGEQCP